MTRATPRTAVLACPVAGKVGNGGHAWFVLQYALGFSRLGWDVVLCDRLDVTSRNGESPPDVRTRAGVAWLSHVLSFVPAARWSLSLEDDGNEVERLGLSCRDLADLVDDRSLLVDVMGFCSDRRLVEQAGAAVYIDIDPGFGQMWRALDLVDDDYAGYAGHFTVGTNVGRPGCDVPSCGVGWQRLLPPVVLAQWPVAGPPPTGAALTSVATWRGVYDPVEYRGRRYGLRVHEFRKFADLPATARLPLEVALAIDTTDVLDRDRLVAAGWRLRHPGRVAGDPKAYRRYVRRSYGEFAVAKEMYVSTRSGWFSDRTACFLASGRPAVVQDTGVGDALPTGAGLLTFRSFDDAVACVEDVADNYSAHCEAARQLALEHLDSDVVLGGLLEQVGAA